VRLSSPAGDLRNDLQVRLDRWEVERHRAVDCRGTLDEAEAEAPCRLAGNRDAVRIAPEDANVGAHPVQRQALVEEAVCEATVDDCGKLEVVRVASALLC
jgi:hypothetical protein